MSAPALHTLRLDHRLRQAWVDGESLLRGTHGYYCLDVVELVRAAFSTGLAWPMTCGCGIPGCSGLFEAVRVSADPSHVVWEIPYDTPRRYVFDAQTLRREVRRALEEAREVDPASMPGDRVLIADQDACSWTQGVDAAWQQMLHPTPTSWPEG